MPRLWNSNSHLTYLTVIAHQLERHVMTAAPLSILSPDPAGLAKASQLLQAGRLVAFPTETVYGLGADARNDTAVAGIYAAKGRPSFNPLIVHLADQTAAEQLCMFNGDAQRLAAAFWPGALTLVLPLKPDAGVSKLVTAGLDTLAIRVPNHPTASMLLQTFDGPIAAPSANPSGRISPTTAAHVRAGLADKIDGLVDGGTCGVGLESTIVSCTGTPLLRPSLRSRERPRNTNSARSISVALCANGHGAAERTRNQRRRSSFGFRTSGRSAQPVTNG